MSMIISRGSGQHRQALCAKEGSRTVPASCIVERVVVMKPLEYKTLSYMDPSIFYIVQ